MNIDLQPVCIIGARKGSTRLPEKNRKEILGRSLYNLALDAAVAADIFSNIIFTTDDDQIIQGLSDNDRIIVDQREPTLSDANTIMWKVGLYILEKYRKVTENTESICFINPCHPFRSPALIREAYQQFIDTAADSLVSVTEFPAPPELAVKMVDGRIKRNWQGPVRKSEHQQSYYVNGAISIVNKSPRRPDVRGQPEH